MTPTLVTHASDELDAGRTLARRAARLEAAVKSFRATPWYQLALLTLGIFSGTVMGGQHLSNTAITLEILKPVQRSHGESVLIVEGRLRNRASTTYSLVHIGLCLETLPRDDSIDLIPASELLDLLGPDLLLSPGEYSGPLLTLEKPSGLQDNLIVSGGLELIFKSTVASDEPLWRVKGMFSINPPQLRISLRHHAVRLSWVSEPEGLVVQSSTNLHHGWAWRTLTNEVEKAGSENVVTIQVDSSPRYFRLCMP